MSEDGAGAGLNADDDFLEGLEEFTRKHGGIREKPALMISAGKGYAYLNAAAHELIGLADRIVILYNPSTRTIALRPASAEELHSYVLTRPTRGEQGRKSGMRTMHIGQRQRQKKNPYAGAAFCISGFLTSLHEPLISACRVAVHMRSGALVADIGRLFEQFDSTGFAS